MTVSRRILFENYQYESERCIINTKFVARRRKGAYVRPVTQCFVNQRAD